MGKTEAIAYLENLLNDAKAAARSYSEDMEAAAAEADYMTAAYAELRFHTYIEAAERYEYALNVIKGNDEFGALANRQRAAARAWGDEQEKHLAAFNAAKDRNDYAEAYKAENDAWIYHIKATVAASVADAYEMAEN